MIRDFTLFTLLVAVSPACGDDGSGSTDIATTASDTSADAADTSVAPDAPTTDATVADDTTVSDTATTEDTAAVDTSTSEDTTPTCVVANPVFPVGQKLAIVGFDLATNEVMVRNVGLQPLDIAGWKACFSLVYEDLDGVLEAGQPGTFQPATPLGATSDFGIFTSADYTSPTALHAFVEWGAGGQGRESVAVQKGLWSSGKFVDTSRGTRFVAVGDVTRPEGWALESDLCPP